jgi:hypothetical protein
VLPGTPVKPVPAAAALGVLPPAQSAAASLALASAAANARAASVTPASAAPGLGVGSLGAELRRAEQYLRAQGRTGAVPPLSAAIKLVKDGALVTNSKV